LPVVVVPHGTTKVGPKSLKNQPQKATQDMLLNQNSRVNVVESEEAPQ